MQRPRVLAALLVVGWAAAGAAGGQQWRGDRSARGRVADVDGQPIAGAVVQLSSADDTGSQPPPATTDEEGRWSVAGLAPGRYALSIKARGFINSNGAVGVSSDGAPPVVEAELLPLSWEPPAFSEGNAITRQLWVEKGNSLLEQGDPVGARELYARLLGDLPRAGRPEVLRAISRTHFMEGHVEAAITALEEALDIAPADPVSRQLYTVLMEDRGQGREAKEHLAELDARPPAPAESAPAAAPETEPEIDLPEEILALLSAPAEPPVAGRVGSYKTFFTERSPWSTLADYAWRMETNPDAIRSQDPDAGGYSLPEETFQVLVPESYTPDGTWGVLAWVSPTLFGGSRRPETLEALAAHKLIWIGANNASNRRPVRDRIWLALDALHNVRTLYDLDPDRLYVGGYSGGGRTASRIGVLYPDAVRGAWSLYGCDYYREIPIPERPGMLWPAKYPRPPAPDLRRVQHDTRFVLVTGPRDFNFSQTRATRNGMVDDGFEHVTYIEIPGANHYTFPDAEWLGRIFAALDGEPTDGGS